MYSSERAEAIVMKDVAFLGAGIHDNVKFDSLRIDKSPIKGNYFIEFKFDKDGKTMTHTEWEPSRSTPQGTLSEKEFLDKCDKQFRRLSQILKCWYSKEQLSFNGESFKELIDWVKEKLDNVDKSKLLRIKVVYNDKGYTTLPKYAAYTFIETMEAVEKGEGKITELGMDQFTKPVVADLEKSNPSPYAVAEGTVDNNDNPNGLPF